jgi:hypothetical protein
LTSFMGREETEGVDGKSEKKDKFPPNLKIYHM